MSLRYAHQQFTEAAHALQIRRDPKKERLATALACLTCIRYDRDLPEGELRQEFRQLMGFMKRRPAELPGEDSAHAAVRLLTDDEADELATRIAQLSVKIKLEVEARRET